MRSLVMLAASSESAEEFPYGELATIASLKWSSESYRATKRGLALTRDY